MDNKYEMRIGMNALKHLGIGLYSNIPAVLSETVANAWDADASSVEISMDYGAKTIMIQDDGHGMSVDDANKKYLYVGYERRKECGTTQKGRKVMGRKGIGKLSLFSIACTVRVQSVRNGKGHGFVMRIKDIENAFKNDEPATYHPEPTDPADDLHRGTRITLSDLRSQMRRNPTLKRRLARRFSVVGDDFEIRIDGEPITPEDRGYEDKLQCVWVFGEEGKSAIPETADLKHRKLSPDVSLEEKHETIDGWIGTARKSGQLKENGQSVNRISIMVRGKMAQEDMLEEIGEGGLYSKYIVGEVYADFLDQDDKDDASTTNRQKIMEHDPRYCALKKKIREELKKIESDWTGVRNQEGEKKALEIGEIREWYDTLQQDRKKAAKKLFGSINRLPVDDDDDKRRLFIGGILAFESLKLRDMLDRLDEIDVGSLDMLTRVFLQQADLEASSYYQTVKNRLEIIHKLKKFTEGNELEKVVRDHIFDNLWLVDPSWKRIPGTENVESRITTAFGKLDENLTDEEKRARVDIKYRELGGKNVIIELKRAGVVTQTPELLAQIIKYRNATRTVLQNTDKKNETVEFVCVLGSRPGDWNNPDGELDSRRTLSNYSARVVFYDELIGSAEKAHAQYIQDEKKVSRLYDLIARISPEDRGVMNPSVDG